MSTKHLTLDDHARRIRLQALTTRARKAADELFTLLCDPDSMMVDRRHGGAASVHLRGVDREERVLSDCVMRMRHEINVIISQNERNFLTGGEHQFLRDFDAADRNLYIDMAAAENMAAIISRAVNG